jgi:hypothetical protein
LADFDADTIASIYTKPVKLRRSKLKLYHCGGDGERTSSTTSAR